MNRFVILLIAALAIAVGYLLGTEQGRQQRDQLMDAIEKRRGSTPHVDVPTVDDVKESLTDTVT